MKIFKLMSFTGIVLAMGMATTFGQASAAVIYQSASPGPADCSAGGSILDNTQRGKLDCASALSPRSPTSQGKEHMRY
jgi:hypothetical protein